MNKTGKAKKSLLFVLVGVLVLAGILGAVRYALDDKIEYNKALEEFTNGNYEQAKHAFSELEYLDSKELATECDYLMAAGIFESGRIEDAMAAFETLGEYKDSQERVIECRYLLTLDKMNAGQYAEAAEEFEELGNYSDAPGLREECLETLYQSALDKMLKCDFEEAAETLEFLGGYKNSVVQLNNCLERIEMESSIADKRPIVSSKDVLDVFDEGKIYGHSWGMVYVPDEVNEDTGWLIYYPGGCGSGLNLATDCVWMQHSLFNPNGIMIYMYQNGFYQMRDYILSAFEVMKQIAVECDIWFHDMCTVGSSNGAYAAIMTSPVLYAASGIAIDNVISFDAGCDWDIYSRVLLTEEECDTMAEAGTNVYLFENIDFTEYAMDVEPVAQMIESGSNIIIVECLDDEHNNIGPDVIRAGGFQCGINEQEHLDSDGFYYWRAHENGEMERLNPENLKPSEKRALEAQKSST